MGALSYGGSLSFILAKRAFSLESTGAISGNSLSKSKAYGAPAEGELASRLQSQDYR
jgi:hypothetical protein